MQSSGRLKINVKINVVLIRTKILSLGVQLLELVCDSFSRVLGVCGTVPHPTIKQPQPVCANNRKPTHANSAPTAVVSAGHYSKPSDCILIYGTPDNFDVVCLL